MGNANVQIKCPNCSHTSGLRFNPGNPYEAGDYDLALQEEADDHPDHSATTWKFRETQGQSDG